MVTTKDGRHVPVPYLHKIELANDRYLLFELGRQRPTKVEALLLLLAAWLLGAVFWWRVRKGPAAVGPSQ